MEEIERDALGEFLMRAKWEDKKKTKKMKNKVWSRNVR